MTFPCWVSSINDGLFQVNGNMDMLHYPTSEASSGFEKLTGRYREEAISRLGVIVV